MSDQSCSVTDFQKQIVNYHSTHSDSRFGEKNYKEYYNPKHGKSCCLNSATQKGIQNNKNKNEQKYETEDGYQCFPNGNKIIHCFICNAKLTKIYKLRLHMTKHKNDSLYDVVDLENMVITHILNPHKRRISVNIIRNFIIQEIKHKRCSQFYTITNEIGTNMHISDSETESENDDIELPRINYKCEICDETFNRRFKIFYHQTTKHSATELFIECDYCMSKFASMNLLIHHLKTVCESDEIPTPCIERFKKFVLQSNLDQYQAMRQARQQRKNKKSELTPKKYRCDMCNKAFNRQEHMNRHQAVHLPDDLKLECAICNRKFNRKDNLKSHMKTHSDNLSSIIESRTILCAHCGKSFGSKSNYVVHMRRHTGEKPYKCDYCHKAFPKSTDLHSHRVTHTKEKNYICHICSKAYARSAVLSKHMRVHRNPFNCIFCKKSFTKTTTLKIHLRRSHANENIFCCGACGEIYKEKKRFEEHQKVVCYSADQKKIISSTTNLTEPANRLSPNLYINSTDVCLDPLEINNVGERAANVKCTSNGLWISGQSGSKRNEKLVPNVVDSEVGKNGTDVSGDENVILEQFNTDQVFCNW